MVVIAATGVVVAGVGTVVAWRLVGEMHTALDDSLALTEESLATVQDTITLAEVVVADVATGLGTLDATLVQLEATMGEAEPVLGDVAALSSDVPEALDEVQRTLDGVAGAAREIDAVLAALASLPLAPAYDPQNSLAGQLDGLSRDLQPVIDTLRGSSANLEGLAASTAELRADVARLSSDVAAVNATLDDSARLVGRYRAQAERAGDLATTTRQDLGATVTTMRVLIVVAGLLYAASQFVPLWVGLELMASPPPDPPSGPPER